MAAIFSACRTRLADRLVRADSTLPPLILVAGDFEVELDPPGFAQLTRTNEHKWRELKGDARDRHAFVAFDRTQQLSNPLGIRGRRHVPHEHGLQGTAQVRCWIALGAAGRDGVPEDLPTGLQCAMYRFDRSACLDPAHRLQQLRSLDLAD